MNNSEYIPAELRNRVSGLYERDFQEQKNKYQAALYLLEQSKEKAEPFSELAKIYIYEARVTGEHPYYYPAALAAINQGLTIEKNNTELLLLKTSVLLSLHHFVEAKTLATQLSSTVRGVAPIFGMLCDANVELGNYADAVRAADAMMNIRPGLESYARVSHLREIHGDMQGALEAMRMAVQAGLPGTEDAAWTRTTYANLLLNSGNINDAEAQYNIAKLERNNYPFALAGLAKIEYKKQNYPLALTLLDSAIRMVPEISFVEQKAEIYRTTNNYSALNLCLEQMEKMLDEDESAGHSNYGDRALIYATNNYKVSAALDYARKELALRPNNITAQFTMAKVLVANKKIAEAKNYLNKAMRLNTTNPEFIGLLNEISSSTTQAHQ